MTTSGKGLIGMSDRAYIATRKGVFTVARINGSWTIDRTAFLGDNASIVSHDSRDAALYLALGWLVLVSGFDLLRTVSWRGLTWVAMGGVAYTLGAVCEWFKWPIIIPGVLAWHEVCHLLDMIGTACHLIFMIRCVLPYRHPSFDTTDQIAEVRAA